MKRKVTQVDGNTAESENKDSIQFKTKSETNNEECFKALRASETCEVCNEVFETQKECYEHMFLSKSQGYLFTILKLIKCGIQGDWNTKKNYEDSWSITVVVIVHS